ncbi:MAG: inositol monophosphatase family protein [Alphaproteobacteria bacterium]
MVHSPLLNVMVKAARKAARGLVRDFGEVENLQVSRKGPADFVTAADRKSEEIIHAELSVARPDFGFLMEEGGQIAGKDASHRWIIDPLDGTTNFIHAIPHFAISIGLEREGTIIAGLVYNPISDEMYLAERGRGATLNDQRLRVSARAKLEDSLLACGMPFKGKGDPELFTNEQNRLIDKVSGIRRYGAAALDLSWVAAGRFEGFWERGLAAWDVAAGGHILKESGGQVTDLMGRDDWLTGGTILGTNDAVHDEVLKLLRG